MASPALAARQASGGSSTRLNLPSWACALALAVPLALAYLILAPPAADLAAVTYRSDLFARVGFALRDNGWYAAHGHYLPGYSVLAPALGAWLGVRVVLALSAVAAAALFGLIAQRVFAPGAQALSPGAQALSPAAARAAATWFALGICVGLLSGRMPYDVGMAIGLGSVLASIGERTRIALGLAVVTSLASPVAGAFLALAGLAAGRLRLALAALLPIVILALAFPEGGYEPFAPSAFWPALAGVLLIALLLPQGTLTPRTRRVVRIGAALYALALIGSFALRTPVGGNAARLGALLAGPLLAGVLWDRHRLALGLLAPMLLYWQLVTPIRDLNAIAGDPSVQASYYAPLRAELRRLTGGARAIVEVPLTGAHWEAAYLAGHDGIALARGWERQLDTRYAGLFYQSRLTSSSYQAWLRENRVAYVALPDARLDYAGRKEGALIAHGLPYLREVWRSPRWRLYVLDARSR
jgi:hypothetical protein